MPKSPAFPCGRNSLRLKRRPGAPHLLVFGGSQGARIFNTHLPHIIKSLLEAVPGLTVLHQSGLRNFEATQAAYAASGADPARWQVQPFLDKMAAEFARAHLIMSRSGASTVAEEAAAGKPALLVPFAAATDEHQRRNAEAMVAAGAAVMLEEKDLDIPGKLLCDSCRIALAILRGWRRWPLPRARRRIPARRSRIADRLAELAEAAELAGWRDSESSETPGCSNVLRCKIPDRSANCRNTATHLHGVVAKRGQLASAAFYEVGRHASNQFREAFTLAGRAIAAAARSFMTAFPDMVVSMDEVIVGKMTARCFALADSCGNEHSDQEERVITFAESSGYEAVGSLQDGGSASANQRGISTNVDYRRQLNGTLNRDSGQRLKAARSSA